MLIIIVNNHRSKILKWISLLKLPKKNRIIRKLIKLMKKIRKVYKEMQQMVSCKKNLNKIIKSKKMIFNRKILQKIVTKLYFNNEAF